MIQILMFLYWLHRQEYSLNNNIKLKFKYLFFEDLGNKVKDFYNFVILTFCNVINLKCGFEIKHVGRPHSRGV